MPRKTIQVADLLFSANNCLSSEHSTPDAREAICTFIENVLMKTKNYRGYRYLDTDEIEGNGTRRFYFVSSAIQEQYSALESSKN